MFRRFISVLALMIVLLHPWNVQAVSMGIASDGGLLTTGPLETESESYTVKSGDTLYRIAVNQGLSVETLKLWNGLTTNTIHPRDELIVISQPETLQKIDQTKKSLSAQLLPAEKPAIKELTMIATAYTAYCEGCSGTTYTGQDLRSDPNQKVIAVDPKVVPIGSKVWVENYGEAIAGDIGGAIKGNKIDVFIPSYERAMDWGVKQVTIRILD